MQQYIGPFCYKINTIQCILPLSGKRIFPYTVGEGRKKDRGLKSEGNYFSRSHRKFFIQEEKK